MKIGLITITNGQNYGNRLQNYASQYVLESIGCEVDTLKNTTGQEQVNDYIIKKLLKKYITYIYLKSPIIKNKRLNKVLRNVKFDEFTKKLIKQSEYVINKDNIPLYIEEKYDYFICGSDQVWNPNFYFNSEVDFLTFAKRGQRIAYSPSFGVSEIQDEKKDEYIRWINGMDYLSVREQAGADIIKNLTNREAIVLVDPTMMLSKNEWLSIAKMPKWKSEKKYILTYFLGNKDEEAEKKINKIAIENSLEIINLMDINNKNIYCVDPREFVALINNAELMCTDSFHGIVFSLIMKTNFILFNRKDKEISMNSRLETLLSKFNMQCRLEENMTDNNQIFNTDFSNVDKVINDEKEKAIKYLKNSLNIK